MGFAVPSGPFHCSLNLTIDVLMEGQKSAVMIPSKFSVDKPAHVLCSLEVESNIVVHSFSYACLSMRRSFC